MNETLFDIKHLNFKETRKEVYSLFRRYNRLLRLEPVRSMPSVTSSYSFIPPSTDTTLNSIESSVHKNMKREQLLIERNELLERVHYAIDNLKAEEKYIIVNKYLQDDKGMDYEIYTELGIGKTKYYTIKNDAVVRLAFYLGIEVYDKEVNAEDELC